MAEEKEKKEVKQVAKGKRTERSLAEKAGDLFLSEDTRTVKNYIIWDVLIPGLKNAFADVVIGGIEMALFGSSRGRRSSRGGETHVSYNGYYDRGGRSSSSNRMDRSNRPDRYDFGSICLIHEAKPKKLYSQWKNSLISMGKRMYRILTALLA